MTTQQSLNSRNILLSYTTTDPNTQSEFRKVIVTTQEDAARFLNDTQLLSCTDSDWRDLKIERYEGLSDEALEALRYIRMLQDAIESVEQKIVDGDISSIEDAMEQILTTAVFTGIRTLQEQGYCEPDDDLSAK